MIMTPESPDGRWHYQIGGTLSSMATFDSTVDIAGPIRVAADVNRVRDLIKARTGDPTPVIMSVSLLSMPGGTP
jgi:hypothetical protein